MRFGKHKISDFGNILMRTFYSVSRCHYILIKILADKFSVTDILDIFALMFGLCNKDYSPIPIVILNFNYSSVRQNA